MGLHRARIEDITARSGVSKGAFYLHFESKEALFEEALRAFEARLQALGEQRLLEMKDFTAQHGALNAADFAGQTPRGQAFIALEAQHDRRVLELMWEERQVFDVLLRGCKGTRFDGMVWELTTREVERVQGDFERFKAAGCCRADIPSDVYASMLVGAWLMIARKMAAHDQKPDFEQWLEALHRLVREGAAPRAPAETVAVAPAALRSTP